MNILRKENILLNDPTVSGAFQIAPSVQLEFCSTNQSTLTSTQSSCKCERDQNYGDGLKLFVENIDPSQAYFTLQSVFIRKRDEPTLFCSVSRSLNAVIIWVSHTILHLDECIIKLSHKLIFSIAPLDIGKCRLQNKIPKKSFPYYFGFRFIRMPFVLNRPPRTVQRVK